MELRGISDEMTQPHMQGSETRRAYGGLTATRPFPDARR